MERGGVPHGTRNTRAVSGENELLSRRVTDLLNVADALLNAVNASLNVNLPLSGYEISSLIRAVDTVPPPPGFIAGSDTILWAGIRPNLPLVGPVDTDEGRTASASTNTKKSSDS
jgi:hypothetical protein